MLMETSEPFEGFGSACVHAGSGHESKQAHLEPIYASSTFVFDSAEQGMNRFSGTEPGYIYSRWGNPTFLPAEEKIAALEAFGIRDGTGQPVHLKAWLHASGMAALNTLFLTLLNPGDTVLSHFSLYGGTQELLEKVLSRFGVHTQLQDLHDLDKAERAFRENGNIRLLYLETPANPTLRCVDLEALIRLANQYGIPSAVDNTFATPYLQQPFRYGADFVMHSTTKFLNGHGTAIGGVLLAGRDHPMNGSITKNQRLLGGNANPFDAFLLTVGLKTLEIRMRRHCDNALELARFLEGHPAVQQVNYPGLDSHPDRAIAQKQMKHPGAMMSFELKGGMEAGIKLIDRVRLCVRAVSLGTCDTLVSHPASMSHFGIPRQLREQYGIRDGLIRMSVGIENLEDLVRDLDQALG